MEQVFQSAKSAIKRRFPGLIPIYGRVYRRLILQPRLRRMSVESIFDGIYQRTGWGGTESRSGRGSSLSETAAIREALPILVAELGIRSMLDIPCVDGHWMSQVVADIERYIGADIVPDLLIECRARWRTGSATATEFARLNLVDDALPSVDLIFCRECLVHLSFSDALPRLRTSKRANQGTFSPRPIQVGKTLI
jgi:hypothetical protein